MAREKIKSGGVWVVPKAERVGKLVREGPNGSMQACFQQRLEKALEKVGF